MRDDGEDHPIQRLESKAIRHLWPMRGMVLTLEIYENFSVMTGQGVKISFEILARLKSRLDSLIVTNAVHPVNG